MIFTDSEYAKYKAKVDRYLRSPDPSKLDALFEDIKAANFMNKISDNEAEFLINLLPIEGATDVDDGPEEEEDVTQNKSRIGFSGFTPRKREHDELDDFEDDDDDEEETSGFLGLIK